MSKRVALLCLLLVVVMGSGVRAYKLTARSLWFDEAFSWRLSQFPLPEMLARSAQDVHPPLYYLLLKGWTNVFGASLLALRSFSVTLAAATIAAGYVLVAYALSSRAAGLTTALLLAVSGFEIQFSWEARMYTLGTFLALVSTWCLLHALTQQSQRAWWWLTYAAAAAAFAYTHYYAFFSLAAQALFVILYILVATRGRVGEILHWKVFWFALLAALVALGLFAPWLPIFLQQQQQVQASFWIPPLDRWSIPDTFYRMYLPTTEPLSRSGTGLLRSLLPLVATLGMWTALLLLARFRRGTPRAALACIVLSGVVPFAVSVVFSLVTPQSVYQDRFFIFAHLFILLGWAALCWSLPWRIPRIVVISAAVIFLAAGSVHYWVHIDIPRKPGAHAAAQEIFRQRTAAEPVVVSSPFVFFAIDHYAEEEFAAKGSVKLFSETGQLAHFAGGPILTAADVVDNEVFRDRDASAVWVVDTSGFGGSPLIPPREWHAVWQRQFPEVYEYQGEVSVTRYLRTTP